MVKIISLISRLRKLRGSFLGGCKATAAASVTANAFYAFAHLSLAKQRTVLF